MNRNRSWMIMLLSVVAVFVFAAAASAQTPDSATFIVSASVPSATNVGFFTSRVDIGTGQFTVQGSGNQSLLFGALKFDNPTGTFVPATHFFAIDIGAVDASGVPAAGGTVGDVAVTFGGETMPTTALKGLGAAGTLTYVKVADDGAGGQTETPLRRSRVDSPLTVASSLVTGGFLRIYVGISTGQTVFTDGVSFTGPAPQPFTPADVAGAYDATMTMSATLNP